MNSTRPLNITADRTQKTLSIIWEDQHQSTFPLSLVRAACPCAECRGGHSNMRSTPDPMVFDMPMDDTSGSIIENIEAVGNYAITIEWQDGHSFGIYNWGYLRALCPCPSCRGKHA